MHSGFFFHEDREWMSNRAHDLFEVMRKTRATQQWMQYVSNWPIALNALRQLWEQGRVSQLKSPFWESPKKSTNQ